MAIDEQSCKVCAASTLEDIAEFRPLPRVTSDCFSFRNGGRLLICNQCGAAQSPADGQWFEEIREIYSTYNIYHQAAGVEQHVLDPASHALRPRSDVLLDRLAAVPGVPQKGRLLDVGCGTGGTLKTFAARGGWRLSALDQDERHLPLLVSIQNFDTLYTCTPGELMAKFDLVTMVHSLEHFPDPLNTLRALRNVIALGGRLFVQVPNAEANPFEYLVADHMVHFTPSSLYALAAAAGFELGSLATNWVTKELSLVLKPAEASIAAREPCSAAKVVNGVRSQIDWLRRFVDDGREAARSGSVFGLFGSSIAATWLCGVLGDRVSFFVDEDPHRVGRTHMNRPILSPTEVPHDCVVYMSLIRPIAEKIANRLVVSGIDLRLPPP